MGCFVLRPRFVLASRSPRRQALLQGLGLDLTVRPPDFDEDSVTADTPQQLVERLALGKAASVVQSGDGAVVIGSDTVVVLEGALLGKPRDAAQAADMLGRLSGRAHEVYTGIALIGGGRQAVDCVVTRVFFRDLTPGEIARYIASGEPFDKAGGYGIQGLAATMVRRIEGDYFAVMGFPLCRFSELLRVHFGIDLL
ncbi:MAG: septum formation inhibitor Maf [Clostridiales bacterium]|nr:septum formation inhibitor Maf [Clostridiales bacterium]